MSSCLSGGGRAAYTIDLDLIKSPSTSLGTSHSSSPSSTISESSNSPLAISTRKPRTPRKRPNQTYNEAAALLSTAYPNIFSVKDICKPCKFIKPHEYSSFSFEEDSSDLFLPFPLEKPGFQIDSTAYDKPCSNDMDEICCQTNSSNVNDDYDDFDAESILDEEIGEGVIDSIMGNLSVQGEEESTTCSNAGIGHVSFCYGYPVGLGLGLGLGFGEKVDFGFGFGLMRGGMAKAFRQRDEGEWWRFPVVDVGEISPRYNKPLPAQKKKKIQKFYPYPPSSSPKKENSLPVSKSNSASSTENSISNLNSITTSCKENPVPSSETSPGVLLKLNYDEVLNAWSDRGSPFSDDILGFELSGSDALVCFRFYIYCLCRELPGLTINIWNYSTRVLGNAIIRLTVWRLIILLVSLFN